jgi:hypothetical protein
MMMRSSVLFLALLPVTAPLAAQSDGGASLPPALLLPGCQPVAGIPCDASSWTRQPEMLVPIVDPAGIWAAVAASSALSVPAPRERAVSASIVRDGSISRIGRLLTGGLVGGWLGYFASQVVVSDWEAGRGTSTERGAWSAGGAVLGLLAGHLLPVAGSSPQGLRPVRAANRRAIEREDIVHSAAVNAYELVRSLRKDWLIPRGLNSWRESARGSAGFGAPLNVVPGADHILVYLDNARLGGTQTLEEVSLDAIERVEFVDGAEATFRWGSGHAHGVILLSTLRS